MRDRIPVIKKRSVPFINYAARRFVGITGGRDRNPTKDQLRAFGSIVRSHHLGEDGFWRDGPTTLAEGTAVGIDRAITRLVRSRLREWFIEPFPAQWNAHFQEAGKVRNAVVVRVCDYLVCFGGGYGTWNAVRQALGIGRPVVDLSGLGPREGEDVVPVVVRGVQRTKKSDYIKQVALGSRGRFGKGKANPPGQSGDTGSSSR